MSVLGSFDYAIRAVQAPETAIAAGLLLVAALVYVAVNPNQRVRRAPQVILASVSIVCTLVTWVCLDNYYAAWAVYNIGSNDPYPQIAFVAVVTSAMTVLVVVMLSLYAITGAWHKLTNLHRAALITGAATLVASALSVAAACYGAMLLHTGVELSSLPEVVFAQIQTYSRDIAVLTFASFIVLACTAIGSSWSKKGKKVSGAVYGERM